MRLSPRIAGLPVLPLAIILSFPVLAPAAFLAARGNVGIYDGTGTAGEDSGPERDIVVRINSALRDVEGRSFAQADYGVLKVSAIVLAEMADSNGGVAMARALWSDSLTIHDPDRTGQIGRLRVSLLMSNSFVVAGPFSRGEVVLETASGVAGYSEQVGFGSSGDSSLLRVHTFEREFRFGNPFDLTIALQTTASTVPDTTRSPGDPRTAIVDYAHTLTWGGSPEVLVGGAPVTGFTMTSDSGFDYLAPAAVPEPSSVALIALGVGVLTLRRRR